MFTSFWFSSSSLSVLFHFGQLLVSIFDFLIRKAPDTSTFCLASLYCLSCFAVHLAFCAMMDGILYVIHRQRIHLTISGNRRLVFHDAQNLQPPVLRLGVSMEPFCLFSISVLTSCVPNDLFESLQLFTKARSGFRRFRTYYPLLWCLFFAFLLSARSAESAFFFVLPSLLLYPKVSKRMNSSSHVVPLALVSSLANLQHWSERKLLTSS